MANRPSQSIDRIVENRITKDPYLRAYTEQIIRRIKKTDETEQRLTQGKSDLAEFASGYKYFGMHFDNGHWVFREWAPNATAIYLKGSFNNWNTEERFLLKRVRNHGVWEIEMDESALADGDLYRLEMHWDGGHGERIPAWARRVVQDKSTSSFNAQVWKEDSSYNWKNPKPDFRGDGPLLIYEAHIGMAQEEEKISTYSEFKEKVLPRIRDTGYNTIQLMAIAEHPYYASFGYQVSSFFACSSWFGPPEELKALIDAAHGMGLLVLMDLIHSHAIKNDVEGLSHFDGTEYQYFHAGSRGDHSAWDSRCFNYEKPEVLHFLLSNCRYWLNEFNFDGFRFDGVTSMLYIHHGLGKSFSSYDDYFGSDVDEDALAYLALANRLIHQLNKNAVTVAEDVSGMPGLAVPDNDGGAGFDYRYSMGVADYWIKLVKDTSDEQWNMGNLLHELTNRRGDEKTISYTESHDQALVGDQTLIFRLIKDHMYDHMNIHSNDHIVFRGISLHKMIRLITLGTAGDGYLNFIGNEFGHPEWVDFPRSGNSWSFKYARRQWHLADDSGLKYSQLALFDKKMIELAKAFKIPSGRQLHLLHIHESDKVLAFLRSDLIFVFNWNTSCSFSDYYIPANPGAYRIILDTDQNEFGGHGRQDISITHYTINQPGNKYFLSLYLPSRTAIVLEQLSK